MAATLPPQLAFIMCCRSAFCTGLQVLLELGLVLGAAGITRMDVGIVQELSSEWCSEMILQQRGFVFTPSSEKFPPVLLLWMDGMWILLLEGM